MTTIAAIDGPQGKVRVYLSDTVGPRILFLHSDGGCSDQWREVNERLSGDFETCAVDFRGHGGSDPAANGDYGFDGRADDALAVVDHLRWNRFLIVAHSGGCAVALALAARHSDRVGGIVLVDPATDPRALPKEALVGMLAGLSGPDSLSFLKQYYNSMAGSDKVVRSRILAETDATTTATRTGLGKAIAHWNPEQALDGYRGPMIILGTDVTDGPAALYVLRPDIPYTVIHGTGHWLQMERPDVVADAVRQIAESAEVRA